MAISSRIGGPTFSSTAFNGPPVMKNPITEASSQNWFAGSFVYTTGTGASTVLNVVPTAGTLIYGQCPDAAIGTGSSVPPAALFGTQHYPWDPTDCEFEVSITSAANIALTGTTSGVTWAGGGTGGVALAPGQKYGLVRDASGAYNGMQFLDVDNTTAAQALFIIVRLSPNNTTTDNNPRVIVKINPTLIQG